MEDKIIAAYWLNKLAARKNYLAPAQEGAPVVCARAIDGKLLAGLRAITGSNRHAAFVVFLTAYHVLLRRYFRNYDDVVACPGLSPGKKELWFVFPQEESCSFRELIMKVKHEVQQVMMHMDYDPEKLLEKLSVDRIEVSPFAFVWSPMTPDVFDRNPLFSLSVDEEGDEGLRVTVNTNVGFADPFVAKGFLDHYCELLSRLDVELSRQVSKLGLSRQDTLRECGDFVSAPASTLCDLFKAKVNTCPDRIALIEGTTRLTFEELDRRANRLSGSLHENFRIAKGDVVGVMMPKSIDAVVSILAVLKCGAAYLPVDVDYPKARKDYIVTNSGLKLLLIKGGGEIYDQAAPAYDIDRVSNDGADNTQIPVTVDPDDLAYIIYTSGSTGKPKGAMIPHRGVANMCLAQIDAFDVKPGSRVIWFASFSFDASVSEIFMALCSGSTLLIPDTQALTDRHLFVDFVRESQADIVTLPPGYLDLLTNDDLGPLKTIITAGEAANPARAHDVAATRRYYNAYGPTECSVCVSIYRVDGINPYTRKIPIGKPLRNLRVQILDDQQRDVPDGVEGIIYVSGSGVGYGYINNDLLTRERFIVVDGVRMYNTGDVGRWLPDGNLEFIGRYDSQLKIRGYRVEIEEIEQVLITLPHVQSAVVAAEKQPSGEMILHAFFISDRWNPEELAMALRDMIPSYMIPQRFHAVTYFPQTSNGKVDKRSLLERAVQSNNHVSCVSITGNDMERKLASIWKMTLAVQSVLRSDNFFEVGGHSLHAIRLLNEIEKQFGVRIPFSALFRSPTFLALSDMVKLAEQNGVSEIPRIPANDSYLCSSSQTRLWFLSQMQETSAAYNMLAVLELRGELKKEKLEQSFLTVIDRHESLRTVFRQNSSGEVRQIVLESGQLGFGLSCLDVSGETDPEQKLSDYLKKESLKNFDLANGPLLRVTLVSAGGDKHVLLCCIHHIVSDGWSLGVLLQDVFTIYSQLADGRIPGLKPLAIQHRDYVSWQHSQMETERFTRDRAYWKKQFSEGSPVLELPTDHVRPAMKRYGGGRVSSHIDPKLLSRIKACSHQHNATLFMGLVAMVKGLLYRYTMQEDIVIGTVSAGRDHNDLHDQIGCFINTLALRTQFSGTDTFSQLLGRVKTVTLEAFEHQHYPFELVVAEADGGREMSRHALFDVTVVLQNGGLDLPVLPGNLKVTPYKSSEGFTSKFDLSFDFMEDAGGLNLIVEYSTDLFERETIGRLAGHLCQFAEAVMMSPDAPLSAIDYLSSDEKAGLVSGLSEPGDYDRQATIIGLFEEQVVLNGDRIALKFGEKELSYRTVNGLANQLGWYLRSKYNVGPDDRVALRVPRNEWMIISILGVLKAGGGYVPIDPDYPSERIAYMLSDSGAKAVIDERELSVFRSEQEQWSTENLPLISTATDLAYVIYTSGTTGQPKGVMIENRNIVHFIENLPRRLSLIPGLTMAATTNFTFDISVLEILGSLLSRLQLTLFDDTNPDAILHAIDAGAIDALQVTPSRLNLLFEATPAAMAILGKLKVLLVGGEPMSEKMHHRLRTLSTTKVYNVYGPTETTIWSTSAPVQGTEAVSIGEPLVGEAVYLLSPDNQLVPFGVNGEICISGEGVGRGYLNQHELTASRFVPDPFNPGRRMYRTGDLGRWMKGGLLMFAGRKDEQLKIRGHRIEPGEIQNALCRHPLIEACVITAFPHPTLEDKLLVAFYVARSSVSPSDLSYYLGKMLPTYMIPGHFIPIDAVPLNSSGKADVKSLRALWQGALQSTRPVAPTSLLQEQLLEIWQEILQKESIGVHENFFIEGGNSLKAVKLLNLINLRLDVNLEIKDIFLNPTVEALGNHINAHQWVNQPVGSDYSDNSVIEI